MKKKIIIINTFAILIIICAISLFIYKSINSIDKNIKKDDTTAKDIDKSTINEDGTINFIDFNLEMSIKKSLNIIDKNYKLSISDAEKVIELNLENSNIENISGINFFKNLKSLNLMKNKIKDISDIEELTSLERLYLSDNVISDISPISNLKKLNTLNIAYNEITDISPIKDLNNIDYPFINGNPIVNFNILYNKIDLMSINFAKSLNLSNSDSYIVLEKENKRKLYKNNQIAIDKMKEWVNENINENMSDLEKEYRIINHILDRLEYAYDGNRAIEPDVYGTYINGNTVCFGYALIFQYLANFSGLESYTVRTNLSEEEISSGIENHTWNIVKIDNKYYQVDLTWADDTLNYEYINISNKTMEELHNNLLPIFNLDAYPKTDIDMDKQIQFKYQSFDY